MHLSSLRHAFRLYSGELYNRNANRSNGTKNFPFKSTEISNKNHNKSTTYKQKHVHMNIIAYKLIIWWQIKFTNDLPHRFLRIIRITLVLESFQSESTIFTLSTVCHYSLINDLLVTIVVSPPATLKVNLIKNETLSLHSQWWQHCNTKVR
jgi:hypothetical protein